MRRAVALLLTLGCAQPAVRGERSEPPGAALVFTYPVPPGQPIQIDQDALRELLGGPIRIRFTATEEDLAGGRGILSRPIESGSILILSEKEPAIRIDLDPQGDRYPLIPHYQCVNGALPFGCFIAAFPGVIVFPGTVVAPVPFLWTPFGPVLHCFRTNVLAGRWVVGFVRVWHWVLNTIRWKTVEWMFFQWRKEWRRVRVECNQPVRIIVYGAAITGLPPKMATGERAEPQLHMSVPDGAEAKFRAEVSPPMTFEGGGISREFDVRKDRTEPVTVTSPETGTCQLRLEPTAIRTQPEEPPFIDDPLNAWTEPREGPKLDEAHCRIEVIRVINHGKMTVRIERRWRLDWWSGHWDWVPVLIFVPGAAEERCCCCAAPCVPDCDCCLRHPPCPADCCWKDELCERCAKCPCDPLRKDGRCATLSRPTEKLALFQVRARPGPDSPDRGGTVDPTFRLWYLWLGDRLHYLRPARSAPPGAPRMTREGEALIIELPAALFALAEKIEKERHEKR